MSPLDERHPLLGFPVQQSLTAIQINVAMNILVQVGPAIRARRTLQKIGSEFLGEARAVMKVRFK